MPLDVPSIEQASFCIGSNLVKVDKQLQAISPFGLPGGVHGLSTQIGALRPLLCSTETVVDHRNFAAVGAVVWPSWLVRRSRVDVHGARRKWSCDFVVVWGVSAP